MWRINSVRLNDRRSIAEYRLITDGEPWCRQGILCWVISFGVDTPSADGKPSYHLWIEPKPLVDDTEWSEPSVIGEFELAAGAIFLTSFGLEDDMQPLSQRASLVCFEAHHRRSGEADLDVSGRLAEGLEAVSIIQSSLLARPAKPGHRGQGSPK